MTSCPEGTYASTRPTGVYAFELGCESMTQDEAVQGLQKLLGSIHRFSVDAVPAIAMVARYTTQHESRVDKVDFGPLLQVAKEAEVILTPLTNRVSELLDGGEVQKACVVAAKSGVSVDTVARVEALFFQRLGQLAAQMQLDVAGFDVEATRHPDSKEASSWFGGGETGVQIRRFVVSMDRLGLLSFESLLSAAAAIAFSTDLGFITVPTAGMKTYDVAKSLCGYMSIAQSNRPLIESALNGVFRQYERWAHGDDAGLTPIMRKHFAEIDRIMDQNPKVATAAAAITSFAEGRRLLEMVRPKGKGMKSRLKADDLVAHNLPAVKGWLEMFDVFMETRGVRILANTCSLLEFTKPYAANRTLASKVGMFGNLVDFWSQDSDFAFEKEMKRRVYNREWAHKHRRTDSALYHNAVIFLEEHENEWKASYISYTTTPGATMPDRFISDPRFISGVFTSLFSKEKEGFIWKTATYEHDMKLIQDRHGKTLDMLDKLSGSSEMSDAVANRATALANTIPAGVEGSSYKSALIKGGLVGIGIFAIPLAAPGLIASSGMIAAAIQGMSLITATVSAVEAAHQAIEVYHEDRTVLIDWAFANPGIVVESGLHIGKGATDILKRYKSKAPSSTLDKSVAAIAPWIAASLIKAVEVPTDPTKRKKMMEELETIGYDWMMLKVQSGSRNSPETFKKKLDAFMYTYRGGEFSFATKQRREAAASLGVIFSQMGINAMLVDEEGAQAGKTVDQIVRGLMASGGGKGDLSEGITRLVRANPALLDISGTTHAEQIVDVIGQTTPEFSPRIEQLGHVQLSSVVSALTPSAKALSGSTAGAFLARSGFLSGTIFMVGIDMAALPLDLQKISNRWRDQDLFQIDSSNPLLINEVVTGRTDQAQAKLIDNFQTDWPDIVEVPDKPMTWLGWWENLGKRDVDRMTKLLDRLPAEDKNQLLVLEINAAQEVMRALESARWAATGRRNVPTDVKDDLNRVGRFFVTASIDPIAANQKKLRNAFDEYLRKHVYEPMRPSNLLTSVMNGPTNVYTQLTDKKRLKQWYGNPNREAQHAHKVLNTMYADRMLGKAFWQKYGQEIGVVHTLGTLSRTIGTEVFGEMPDFGRYSRTPEIGFEGEPTPRIKTQPPRLTPKGTLEQHLDALNAQEDWYGPKIIGGGNASKIITGIGNITGGNITGIGNITGGNITNGNITSGNITSGNITDDSGPTPPPGTTQTEEDEIRREKEKESFEDQYKESADTRQTHEEQQKVDADTRENLIATAMFLLSAFVTVMAVAEELPDVSALATKGFDGRLAAMAEEQLVRTGTLVNKVN